MDSRFAGCMAAIAMLMAAGRAEAACQVVTVPEMHVPANASDEALKKLWQRLLKANDDMNVFHDCIENVMKSPPPRTASKEEVAGWGDAVKRDTEIYNRSLNNLEAAAAEYNTAVRKRKGVYDGGTGASTGRNLAGAGTSNDISRNGVLAPLSKVDAIAICKKNPYIDSNTLLAGCVKEEIDSSLNVRQMINDGGTDEKSAYETCVKNEYIDTYTLLLGCMKQELESLDFLRN